MTTIPFEGYFKKTPSKKANQKVEICLKKKTTTSTNILLISLQKSEQQGFGK